MRSAFHCHSTKSCASSSGGLALAVSLSPPKCSVATCRMFRRRLGRRAIRCLGDEVRAVDGVPALIGRIGLPFCVASNRSRQRMRVSLPGGTPAARSSKARCIVPRMSRSRSRRGSVPCMRRGQWAFLHRLRGGRRHPDGRARRNCSGDAGVRLRGRRAFGPNGTAGGESTFTEMRSLAASCCDEVPVNGIG